MHYRHGQPIAGTQYRFIRELGAGGHGTVYAVEHTFLEAPAVMKLLHAELVDRGDLAQRMTREAKTLAKLRHPNLVEVRDGGITTETPARPYFVMESLNGMPLRELLRHVRGSVGVGVMPALRIMTGVLEGLEHAHRAGVVHRDIKPDNIFLHRTATDVTVPKVLDFGIAHLVMGQRTTGQYFLGTPRYAAPEQLRGDVPTARTDIYAAGLLLYEMLTGEPPFAQHKEFGDILRAHMEMTLPLASTKNPDVPSYLAKFVAQMVSKDPDERPPSAFAAAVGIREIRSRIEAKQAGSINNTGFKTEPTPMDNMLFGAGREPLGAATGTASGTATAQPSPPAIVTGPVQDTVVDGPRSSALRSTMRHPPRMVGGGVQHPMAVAATEVDTPQGPPRTALMGPRPGPGGGVDRNAKTNTSAPVVPRSRPNFDTEQLLASVTDQAAFADTQAAAAFAAEEAAVSSRSPEERTTGLIAMSRNASDGRAPARSRVLGKQIAAFSATLLVFAVIAVPVLWKLKKAYAPESPAAAAPEAPEAPAAAEATMPLPSAPPAPASETTTPPATPPATPTATPTTTTTATAPDKTTPAASVPVAAAEAAPPPAKPIATAAPKPRPAPAPAPKPAAKAGDPSAIGFD